MLGGTLVLWVGSSAALQSIFGMGEQFQKPVFVTLFNSAMSASLLLPRLVRRCCCAASGRRGACRGVQNDKAWCADDLDGASGSASESLLALLTTARLSGTVGLLWLCSQWVFNLSLLHTSVATNTVLSSTSSVFTFLFSLLICGDPFRWRSFAAAVASLLGCTLVALENPRSMAKNSVANSAMGDLLALTSAAMFALASVLLRRLAPCDLDASSYMGMNGLVAISLSPALLYAAHSGGLELFWLPPTSTLAFLAANAFVGCTFANYLYTSALLLLNPVVTSVCLSLSIPVSAFFDEVLLQQHQFSAGWALGAAIVAGGAALVALDLEAEALPKESPQATEELQTLLGCRTGGEEDGEELT